MTNWRSHLSGWLDRRIPASDAFQLNLQNIFIFPSKFAGLFLVLCLALFLLGTNFQNNLMLLLCYFLLSLILLNLFIAYLNFAKIQLHVGKVHPVYMGDRLHFPLWLSPQVERQSGVHGLLELTFWRQQAKTLVDADDYDNPIVLDYLCTQRGRLSLPRVTVNSYYPLGLFRCWTHLAFNTDILVYPKPLPCEIDLQTRGPTTQGTSESGTSSGHEDFHSLKVYQQGEPLHHIAWKQLAKGRGMVSKQFVSNCPQRAWLKLKPCSLAEMETKLSHLCFQVLELNRRNQTFGLDLGSHSIAPNSGAEHRAECLKALALFIGPANV